MFYHLGGHVGSMAALFGVPNKVRREKMGLGRLVVVREVDSLAAGWAAFTLR